MIKKEIKLFRLSQVSRRLNISIREAVSILQTNNIIIECNPNCKLEEKHVDIITSHIANNIYSNLLANSTSNENLFEKISKISKNEPEKLLTLNKDGTVVLSGHSDLNYKDGIAAHSSQSDTYYKDSISIFANLLDNDFFYSTKSDFIDSFYDYKNYIEKRQKETGDIKEFILSLVRKIVKGVKKKILYRSIKLNIITIISPGLFYNYKNNDEEHNLAKVRFSFSPQ